MSTLWLPILGTLSGLAVFTLGALFGAGIVESERKRDARMKNRSLL